MTERQRRFIREYLVDLNATQAAIRAGFSAKTAGQSGARLLKDVKIAAEIARLQAERAEKTGITAEKVLDELGVLGFSSVWDYEIDDNGHVTLAPDAPPTAIRAVASIKRKRRTIPRKDDEPIVEVETEIKLWDKPATLRLTGQHLGMYTERHEHSGPQGGPIEVKDHELRARFASRITGLNERIGAGADHSGTNGAGT